MKKMKRIVLILCILLSLLASASPALAAKTSTGFKKGQVIKTTKANTGSGRRRWTYTSSKDVFQSETLVRGKYVRAEGNWHQISKGETLTLSITSNKSISVQGSADIAKKLRFSTSISTGKSVGASYKVDSSRGGKCRLELKCDYIKVTYMHYTYNHRQKQTGAKQKTLWIPVSGSATYYIKYK